MLKLMGKKILTVLHSLSKPVYTFEEPLLPLLS